MAKSYSGDPHSQRSRQLPPPPPGQSQLGEPLGFPLAVGTSAMRTSGTSANVLVTGQKVTLERPCSQRSFPPLPPTPTAPHAGRIPPAQRAIRDGGLPLCLADITYLGKGSAAELILGRVIGLQIQKSNASLLTADESEADEIEDGILTAADVHLLRVVSRHIWQLKT